MTTRRVLFDITRFLNDLDACFYNERPDLIDETIQRYKDFLLMCPESIRKQTMDFVNKHRLVTEYEDIRSYIEACHKQNFEK